jgi:hypothetical protein
MPYGQIQQVGWRRLKNMVEYLSVAGRELTLRSVQTGRGIKMRRLIALTAAGAPCRRARPRECEEST